MSITMAATKELHENLMNAFQHILYNNKMWDEVKLSEFDNLLAKSLVCSS